MYHFLLARKVAWNILEQQQKAGRLANFCPSFDVENEFSEFMLQDIEGQGDEEVISVCELQTSSRTILVSLR